MDERVRQINNTIDICNHLIYTCMNELKDKIGQELFDKCQVFIDKIGEWRHKTVLERHLMKYKRLCQKTKGGHSNQHQGGCSNLTGIRAQNKDVRTLPAVTSNLTTVTQMKFRENPGNCWVLGIWVILTYITVYAGCHVYGIPLESSGYRAWYPIFKEPKCTLTRSCCPILNIEA